MRNLCPSVWVSSAAQLWLILAHLHLSLLFLLLLLPFADALDGNACPLPYNRTVDAATFRDCLASAELVETRNFWIFTAGCFGGALLVMLGR